MGMSHLKIMNWTVCLSRMFTNTDNLAMGCSDVAMLIVLVYSEDKYLNAK
jgi:hypothetical protein